MRIKLNIVHVIRERERERETTTSSFWYGPKSSAFLWLTIDCHWSFLFQHYRTALCVVLHMYTYHVAVKYNIDFSFILINLSVASLSEIFMTDINRCCCCWSCFPKPLRSSTDDERDDDEARREANMMTIWFDEIW